VAGAETQAEPDYQALLEQEKAHRVRERNLYRDAQRILGDLDDGSVNAIKALAEMVRRGDTDGITEWALATAQNVSGKDLAEMIAARQQSPAEPAPLVGQQQAPAPAAPSPDQIREMVAEQVRVQNLAAQITAEMQSAGYAPGDPAGQVIIQYARANGVPINEAIEWFEADAAARVAQRQQRLAQVAAQTPAPAPDGAPAATEPAKDLTPAEKAMARLRAGVMG
jgi:nucleotide-binding universal stress UspA family protein